jgi:DNA polymerase elongation subunit (family B)
VIEDASGFYSDDAMFEILDFTSMYPRGQIAFKICYQNLFFPENMAELDRMLKQPHPDDPELIWVQVSRKETIPVAQKDALLPRIQWQLVLQRKAIKKLMESAYDAGEKFQGDVYNSQQLAKKLAGNSLYGYCNAPITYDSNGKPNLTCLTLKELMLCTTSMGRRAQRTVAYHLTEKYGCIIIGGDTDSVFPWCPVFRELLPDVEQVCEKIRVHYEMDEFWAKHWQWFWEKDQKQAVPEPAAFTWSQVSRYWEQKIRTKSLKKGGDPNYVMIQSPLNTQVNSLAFLVGKKLDQELTATMKEPNAIECENGA